MEDFGHIFTAKIICVFNRHSEVVSGDIRSTLKNPGRFWNINYLADDIDKIVESKGNENALKNYHSVDNRLVGTIENCYKQSFDYKIAKAQAGVGCAFVVYDGCFFI